MQRITEPKYIYICIKHSLLAPFAMDTAGQQQSYESPNVICKYCDSKPLSNKVRATCCGSYFCQVCVMMERPDNKRPCPGCGEVNYTLDLIPVCCTQQSEGCGWKGKDLDLMFHVSLTSQFSSDSVEKCQFIHVRCQYCSDLMQRKNLELHVKECRKRIINCPNETCGCDWSGQEECTTKTITCKYCKETLTNKEYNVHASKTYQCPNHTKGCKWLGLCKDFV